MKKIIATTIAASAFLVVGPAGASERRGIELATSLLVCQGRLAATKKYDGMVDRLSTTRMSVGGALEFINGSRRLRADEKETIAQFQAEFEKQLIGNPAGARAVVTSLRDECMDLVYDAEDVRTTEAQKTAEEKARAEAARVAENAAAERQLQLELAKIQAQSADRKTDAQIEMEKLKATSEISKLAKVAEVENNRIKADVDIEKTRAETAIARTNKAAEVENGRTQASVEIARIDADADVKIAGKTAEIEAARTQATERLFNKALDVEAGKTAAAVEIAKVNAEAQTDSIRLLVAAGAAARSGTASQFALVVDGRALGVQGIGLGDNRQACPGSWKVVTIARGAAGKNAPASSLNTCEFGDAIDKTVVYYDAQGERVVRVQRDLYLTSQDPEADHALTLAAEEYGPFATSADNGTAIVYTAQSEAAKAKQPQRQARGLKIKQNHCPSNACKPVDGRDILVTYNLIDAEQFAIALQQGAR